MSEEKEFLEAQVHHLGSVTAVRIYPEDGPTFPEPWDWSKVRFEPSLATFSGGTDEP